STMDKVSATDYYYFDREYYISLRKAMGESLKLFIALFEGKVISAGLFTHTGSIVQYHLGGTLPDYLRMSAFTCIIDTVREYMTARGAGALHLGGGLGSAEDNLFHFKAGFSDRRHQFSIWKYIANNTHYEKLNQAKEEWNKKNNKTTNENYFPLYRG
ncbi:MAG: GNAT family N-acetyltransferase, partial [bacterium]|nr:GNAT family N-acetyltransferase [bacterium]